MILYRLAKWMEERAKLAKEMKESQGDISYLVQRKEQVDEQMIAQASKWMETNDAVSFPVAGEPTAAEEHQDIAY